MSDGTAEMDERVLEAATKLFSELGYDTTTLAMIADVAGRGSAESDLLKSGKAEIYRAVFERCSTLEKAFFASAAECISYDAQGLHQLVDSFLDFSFDHLEISALWGHRVLKDAIDLDFPERTFTPPLEDMMTSHTWSGIREDLDMQFLAWTIIWMTTGFIGSGLPGEEGSRRRLDEPAAARYFRTQLHELLDARIRA